MTSTSFAAASMYEKEFMELVWEKGEIQVRGPSCRWKSDIVEAKGEKRGKLGSIVNFGRATEDCDHGLKYTTPSVDHHYKPHPHPHHSHEFYSEKIAAAATAATGNNNDCRIVPEYENENDCAEYENECPEYEYAHLKPAVNINDASKLERTITQTNHRLRAFPRRNCSDHIDSTSLPEVVLERQAACVAHKITTTTTTTPSHSSHSSHDSHSDSHYGGQWFLGVGVASNHQEKNSKNSNQKWNKSRRNSGDLSHFSSGIRLATVPKPNNVATNVNTPCTCTAAAAATKYSIVTDKDHQRRPDALGIVPNHHLESLTANTASVKHLQINPTVKPLDLHYLSLRPHVPADEHSEAFGNKVVALEEQLPHKKTKTPKISKPKTKTQTATGKYFTRSPPPSVPSASVCSLGASNSPAHAHAHAHAHPLKRTSEDTEESAYPCKANYSSNNTQSVEDEPKAQAVIKAAVAPGGGRSKRNRTAQIHNLSEKRRRDTINKKMRELKELLPNCNKVDKVSMLDEAIEYLQTLQRQLQMLSMGNEIMAPQMMLPAGAPHLCDPSMMRLSSSLLPCFPTTTSTSTSTSAGTGTGGHSNPYNSGFQMLPFPAYLLPFNTIPLHSLVPPAISRPTTLFDQPYFASKYYSNPHFVHMFYNNNNNTPTNHVERSRTTQSTSTHQCLDLLESSLDYPRA
ncbi:uncharacterized protein LOC107426221 isoform X2 [Ziziphus jujuba]|uniref:Uncharacterized protein LOC107426221 isoform X2 n=1 Tax=Ziziphus jujuba TaxID=326968 RepID=A0ABM3ZUR8_ZIZJJ|nr:uncharacterized protein LOC107426221 isoform X2 [Ziziphus jujuba var. spinosa]XP_060668227.1 uncharacterized protein LOC107426221 isoform X2 [Ziziphus jujuba]